MPRRRHARRGAPGTARAPPVAARAARPSTSIRAPAVTRCGKRRAPNRSRTRPISTRQLCSTGSELCAGGERRTRSTTTQPFSATSSRITGRPSSTRASLPSLTTTSAATRSPCSRNSHPAPLSPSVSSSAVAARIRSRVSGRSPRWASTSNWSIVATMCFMSTAPRPHTQPSWSSPANGSTRHPAALAGTTSVWQSRSTGGAAPLPRTRATRFGRPSASRTSTLDSMPSPASASRRYSTAGHSSRPGLDVSQRMSARRCSTSSGTAAPTSGPAIRR